VLDIPPASVSIYSIVSVHSQVSPFIQLSPFIPNGPPGRARKGPIIAALQLLAGWLAAGCITTTAVLCLGLLFLVLPVLVPFQLFRL
jgi:hypothetical protein